MKVYAINSGFFRLDGGSMFSYIPKKLWSKWNPPDEDNLCRWALRLLLIENNDLLILVDTGLIYDTSPKFIEFYKPEYNSIREVLNGLGYSYSDVTHVILTHLHFDHCGGSVVDGEPAFPSATYIMTRLQYINGIYPNPKEKGSYIKDTFEPLVRTGRCMLVDGGSFLPDFFPGVDFFIFDGHSDGMISPLVKAGNKLIFYPSDLMPSSYHLNPHYHMSYDVRPLLLINDKQAILKRATEEKWVICFEHDPQNPAIVPGYDGKKYYTAEVFGERISESVVRLV